MPESVKGNWWEIDPLAGLGTDPFYEDQLQRTYFISGFRRENILYCRYRLEEMAKNPDMSPEAVENYLYEEMVKWSKSEKNRGISPLEPFLFALKVEGGILWRPEGGMRLDNVDAVARALCCFWDTDSEQDLNIVRHALFYWSWPQSRAVIIRMYTLKPELSDARIDELVRRRLYSPDESELACLCLLAHPSPENIDALLRFFSKLRHTADTGAEINTKGLQADFEDYCRSLSNGEKEELYGLYTARYAAGADKLGKRFLEKVLSQVSPSPLTPLFTDFAAADSAQKENTLQVLRREWDLSVWEGQYQCRFVKQPELLELLQSYLRGAGGISCANALYNLALAQYEPANRFILDTQRPLRRQDPQWMEFSLASNLLCGTPTWEELTEAFFMERTGWDCAPAIRSRISHSGARNTFRKGAPTDKDAVFAALAGLADTLAIPPGDEAQRRRLTEFFSAARYLFTRPFSEDFFPEELQPVLGRAVAYSIRQDSILLATLLDLIESLATRKNRAVYYPMLQDIHDQPGLPGNLRARAQLICDTIF